MDIELEQQIAHSLMRREFSERFLRDLQAPGNSMIHRLPDMLDVRFVMGSSNHFATPAAAADLMCDNGVGNMCYVFSEFGSFHRVYAPLHTALEVVQFSRSPAFLVGLPSGFSYFKGAAYPVRPFSCFLRPFRGFDRIP